MGLLEHDFRSPEFGCLRQRFAVGEPYPGAIFRLSAESHVLNPCGQHPRMKAHAQATVGAEVKNPDTPPVGCLIGTGVVKSERMMDRHSSDLQWAGDR